MGRLLEWLPDFVYCFISFLFNGECLSAVAYGKIGNEPKSAGNSAEDFELTLISCVGIVVCPETVLV